MKKIMHFLFLSCLKATELIEKKIYFRLNRVERMQLKVHKAMCNACANYEKQSLAIEKGIAESLNEKLSEPELVQFKQMIIQKLENQG